MIPLIQESIDIAPSFAGDGMGAIIAVIAGMIFVFILIMLVLYVYSAFALMTIAQKTKEEYPWLAWIPFANMYLMSRIAKQHWWPILLLPAYWFISMLAQIIAIASTTVGLIVMGLAYVVYFVFFVYITIWFWKIFEAVNRPGWWAIFYILIPLNFVFWILLGVAAWGKTPEKK